MNNQQKAKEALIRKQIALAHSNAEFIWSLVDEEIREPDALLNYKGSPVIFPNTSVVIQGKTGSHKSRFASALISLLITNESGKEMYGFSKDKTKSIPVLYIDTERNKSHQLPLMLQKLIEQTGIDKDLQKCHYRPLPSIFLSKNSTGILILH